MILNLIMLIDKSRMHDSDKANYQKYVTRG